MRTWTGSLVILAFFAATLVLLHLEGTGKRRYLAPGALSGGPVPVAVAGDSRELFSLWKASGIWGRVLVHAGRYLHFVEPETEGLYKGLERFPIRTADIGEFYEAGVGNEGFIAVAMQVGVVREVYYVLSRSDYGERRDAVAGLAGVSVRPDRIVMDHWGSPRTLTPWLPAIAEPVVLNVDASYFAEGDGQGLLESIRRSGLRADVVTVNLARDNPEVDDAQREAAMAFASALSGG
jgi:hypothetical protein